MRALNCKMVLNLKKYSDNIIRYVQNENIVLASDFEIIVGFVIN